MKGSISFEQYFKLGQKGEDCWFGFAEVNTIPLQLQITFMNFVKIAVHRDSQDTVSMTPFDSHLLGAATSGVRRKFWRGFIQWCMVSFVFYVHCLWRHNWRRIHVSQTKVLAKFALINHSRQNKGNCFGYSELSRNAISNMRSGRKVCKKWWVGFWKQTIIQILTKT